MKRTPPVSPDAALPDLGTARISAERFISPEWMAREWSRLWRRVWNMGPRVSELPAAGDFVVHALGRESLLFARGWDGRVRGFYNVCQHRGSTLCTTSESGQATSFRCPFHNWVYDLDGTLKHVPGVEDFPLLRGGGALAELSLQEFAVDTWGGWLFFHLGPDPAPLREFLGVVPEHLDPYHPEDMILYEYKSFEWECNWKAACDAFNESYHFRALHPQMSDWANEVAQIELLGIHSRMVNQYGTTSPSRTGDSELGPGMKSYMQTMGMDPSSYVGRPVDVRLEMQRQLRASEADSHFPVADLNDDQLSDVYHYTLFPNVSFNLFPAGINGFRYRPHESDPQKMYYDLLLLAHFPEGEAPPTPSHRTFRIGEASSYAEAIDAPVAPEVTEVLQQDADNMSRVQRGLASEGFGGMVVCDQELRVRHFHQTVDAYVRTER